jgi:hypothetical protein
MSSEDGPDFTSRLTKAAGTPCLIMLVTGPVSTVFDVLTVKLRHRRGQPRFSGSRLGVTSQDREKFALYGRKSAISHGESHVDQDGARPMTPLWSLRISCIGELLLRLAMATIRFMQRLSNHGLISYRTTDRFSRAAKRLEQRAERLMTRMDRGN